MGNDLCEKTVKMSAICGIKEWIVSEYGVRHNLEGTRIGVSVSLPPFSCPLIGEIGGFRRGEIAVQKNNGKIFAA